MQKKTHKTYRKYMYLLASDRELGEHQDLLECLKKPQLLDLQRGKKKSG